MESLQQMRTEDQLCTKMHSITGYGSPTVDTDRKEQPAEGSGAGQRGRGHGEAGPQHSECLMAAPQSGGFSSYQNPYSAPYSLPGDAGQAAGKDPDGD